MIPKTDTQAFLVANDEYAVLAFRGTEVTKKADIEIDAKAIKVSTIEGRVHGGFLGGYNSIRNDILKALKKYGDFRSISPVTHSAPRWRPSPQITLKTK